MKKKDFPEEERVIDRLLAFVEWAKAGKLVKSRSEFERLCGLKNNYLYNTQFMTKKSIGTDVLSRIHKKFSRIHIGVELINSGPIIIGKTIETHTM